MKSTETVGLKNPKIIFGTEIYHHDEIASYKVLEDGSVDLIMVNGDLISVYGSSRLVAWLVFHGISCK